MAMLKFKKGLWSKLPEAKAEGTIYVTTDEKAMYVDISDSERIRLGDIIRVNTFNELQPPFSNEAFYYVEASNALLKRVAVTSENDVVTYEWKQINGTQELQSTLTALTGRVSTLEGTVGSATSGLVKDVNDLKTVVGKAAEGQNPATGLVADVAANAKDIEALQAALGLGEGEEADGTLAGSVAQLRTDLTELETEVHGTDGNGGMVATLADHTSRIGNLETESAKHALKTDLDAFAKTADIQGTLDKVDTEGTVTAAINAAVAGEKSRAEGAEQTLTNNLAAVKNTADSAVPNATFEQFKTDNTTAINNAKTSAVSDATAAAKEYTDDKIAEEVTRANGAYAPKSLVETVAGLSGAIGGAESGIVKDIADNKAAAEKAQADATQALADAKKANDAIGTAEKGLIKDIADAKAAAATADGKAVAAQEAANAAQGAADAAQEDATQALSDAAAAQKTADDYIAAHKDDYTKAQIDTAVADAKKAGTDAASTANANASAISKLQADLKAVTDDYVTESELATVKSDLQKEIDADIRAANAMEYAGTIESASAIPTTGVKNGATYVIGTSFDSYAAGDMLIAQGTEDPDTGLITSPTWAHVKSGYDATLDQQLTGANNQIMLSNGVRNDADAAGAITFAATGSASVEVKNNTVTVGMVWEDFK